MKRSSTEVWREAGHTREPRVSVSRSIFALVDDRDRAYFGVSGQDEDHIGLIEPRTPAVFYPAEPAVLIEQLKKTRKPFRRSGSYLQTERFFSSLRNFPLTGSSPIGNFST